MFSLIDIYKQFGLSRFLLRLNISKVIRSTWQADDEFLFFLNSKTEIVDKPNRSTLKKLKLLALPYISKLRNGAPGSTV